MPMTPPVIPPPPTVPDRSNPVTFPALMNAAFVYLFGAFRDALVTLIDYSASVFVAAETVSAVADVTKWISGTAYAEGAVVWSPSNGHTYRRKTAGSGAVDPSLDTANWWPISVYYYKTQSISANTTAMPFCDYVFTATCTLTLPAAPQPGDWVGIKNKSGTYTSQIAFNGKRFENAEPSGNFIVDIGGFSGRLTYIDDVLGWVFI